MVQTALTPAGSSPGNDWASGTVFPPDDTFAMAVRELANYIISEGVVHVVDRNPRLLSVRQRALSDLSESFGVLADLVEENHVVKSLCKINIILARISCIFKVVSVVSSGRTTRTPSRESDSVVDELAHRGMAHSDGQTQQPIKGRGGSASPIPAKHELVEIPGEVRLAHAVQRAHEPPLEVREGAVDPFQNHVTRHVSDRLAEVLMVGQCLISWQASVMTVDCGWTTRSTNPRTRSPVLSASGSSRSRRG